MRFPKQYETKVGERGLKVVTFLLECSFLILSEDRWLSSRLSTSMSVLKSLFESHLYFVEIYWSNVGYISAAERGWKTACCVSSSFLKSTPCIVSLPWNKFSLLWLTCRTLSRQLLNYLMTKSTNLSKKDRTKFPRSSNSSYELFGSWLLKHLLWHGWDITHHEYIDSASILITL